jgi:hypothetical protein
MNRQYKVKEPTLQKLFIEVYNLSLQFKKISFKHTLRSGNKEADREVNKAIDLHIKNSP